MPLTVPLTELPKLCPSSLQSQMLQEFLFPVQVPQAWAPGLRVCFFPLSVHTVSLPPEHSLRTCLAPSLSLPFLPSSMWPLFYISLWTVCPASLWAIVRVIYHRWERCLVVSVRQGTLRVLLLCPLPPKSVPPSFLAYNLNCYGSMKNAVVNQIR